MGQRLARAGGDDLPFGRLQRRAAGHNRPLLGRGARPDHPNGNAISTVRTNEIDFGTNGLWQLRQFALSADTGRLGPTTINLTPDLSFNNSATLASFINANEAAILAETVGDTDTVPVQFQGNPFLAGAVFNDFFTQWNAPGINNLEARFNLAVNTCNGCHSVETGTNFLQITPRFPGNEASLSGFLTGTTVLDPFAGVQRSFNDLGRRADDLRPIVCPNEPPTTRLGWGGRHGRPDGHGRHGWRDGDGRRARRGRRKRPGRREGRGRRERRPGRKGRRDDGRGREQRHGRPIVSSACR